MANDNPPRIIGNTTTEDGRQRFQAESRAKILLQALYRQINLCANVQWLNCPSTRSSRRVLTDQRIYKAKRNQNHAAKALDMIMNFNKGGREPPTFEREAFSRRLRRRKKSNTPERLMRLQKRLVNVWKSFSKDPEVFSICARTIVFRGAALKETDLVWEAFEKLLEENFVSILAFAQTRRLDTKDTKALLPYDGPIPGPIKTGGRDVETLHPHEIVVNLERQHLERRRFENNYQENIGNYKIHPTCQDDPTLRRPSDGECDVCSSDTLCDCTYPRYPALFLELIETADGRGVGVRTLAKFTKDTMLGAFIGEILSENEGLQYDPVYCLKLAAKTSNTARAVICPKWYGNWARFVNHSCEPSVEFRSRTIGKQIYMMMVALRDIEAFEEITVHYGKRYWREKQCLCRSRACKDKKNRYLRANRIRYQPCHRITLIGIGNSGASTGGRSGKDCIGRKTADRDKYDD
ncbi:SET domain-containing protein [Blastomyces dermatitidis ATCC 18188]|uniref:SET domain-containing protein n=1 Tax=Ajellomyces dermatitidis (strain ATCC 18188 / CBS 674.68) TaxID=653446 RepID=F2TJ10_AJEDA|nr:SET domain-containing protein [Blastomyces dermatitidis ATCC 18188]